MSANPSGPSLSISSSLNLIKIGLLLILLAWGMRGIISSFAQYGIGNMRSDDVLTLKIEDETNELAEDEELVTALAEKRAELQEVQQQIAASQAKQSKYYQARGEERDGSAEWLELDDKYEDAQEKEEELEEKRTSIREDIADIDLEGRETRATLNVEQFERRADAQMDEVSGQAAYASYQQWNLLLSPISMLLYIGGVLCLMLGNIGVLSAGAAGGLRIFSIVSSAIVLLLMLMDAVDLHEPETYDRGSGGTSIFNQESNSSSSRSKDSRRGYATASGW